MARPLRVEYPGAYYHVISRGNNQEQIFKNERNKEKFLQYLEKASERFSIIFHTYWLMSNHFHLLVERPEPNLSVAIYLARDMTGITCKDLGEYFGGVSGALIT